MEGLHRVQVIKRESAALGGDPDDDKPWSEPIEPQEDALECAGIYVQDATHRDETTLMDRLGSDLRFKDSNNPTPRTLSELVAGTGGLTAEQHKTLRQLIHFLDDGPAEGFASGAYREIVGGVFPTSIIWWESASKLKKLVEKTITRTGSGTNAAPTPIVWQMYDTDGTTVLSTVTDAVTYSGVIETSRARTIA